MTKDSLNELKRQVNGAFSHNAATDSLDKAATVNQAIDWIAYRYDFAPKDSSRNIVAIKACADHILGCVDYCEQRAWESIDLDCKPQKPIISGNIKDTCERIKTFCDEVTRTGATALERPASVVTSSLIIDKALENAAQVSVSLEKCADAVGDVINRGGPSLRFEDKDIAKAVLDTAKAQGARFDYAE